MIAASPCGYCRLDSHARIGDPCSRCGRTKAPPWWTICAPVSASTPRDHAERSSARKPLTAMRRHAAAIVLVAIFAAGLGSTAVLAIAGAMPANRSDSHSPAEIRSGTTTHHATQPLHRGTAGESVIPQANTDKPSGAVCRTSPIPAETRKAF